MIIRLFICIFCRAVISLAAAVGFMVYGGRLFVMLRRFPIESRGRQKKLHEVTSLITILISKIVLRYCQNFPS
ncbi:hypothetical protein HanLR1_Chr10g0364261 [Helianthus annuus]|nr:hypothetical protein HanLR1_Chr10g0364261 [Helianthus annuus]